MAPHGGCPANLEAVKLRRRVPELRKPRPHPDVLAWFGSASDKDLHLSAMTLGEQAGVEITRGPDPAKAAEIGAWIDRVAETYSVLALGAADALAPG